MKVKIIGGTNYENLEYEINQFIKDKRVIDIKYQSMYVETEFRGGIPVAGTVFDRALIIYTDEEED